MKRLRKLSKGKACLYGTLAIVLMAGLFFGVWTYMAAHRAFEGPETIVIIPQGASDTAVGDSLKLRLGDYGETVYRLWALRSGNPTKAAGYYRIVPGDRAWSVANRIRSGRSSTVTVKFIGMRLMTDLAAKVSSYFPWDADAFLAACDSVLPHAGFVPEEYPAAFWPNTYEFYGSATPVDVVTKLLDERNKFWNEKRTAQAKELGLTPVEVATIASIVEEESANLAERPTIARLYINRLQRGMKLQADPTVKFAVGDFSLRRIYEKHLKYQSPYNTYQVNGLPPGPIRIPEGATIDAVLTSPPNDYIYMCAKEDFSGTHNFTDSLTEHEANARRYHRELDKRGL